MCRDRPIASSAQLTALILAYAAFATAFAPTVAAETYHVRPDGPWFETLAGDNLKPGDEVVLAAGRYTDARRLIMSCRGTSAAPIIVRAANNADVVFQRPDAKQNTFNLEGTQHLTLAGFEITGGAAGIRISASSTRSAANVTLEDLHIHHIDGVAVTCNHPGNDYSGMIFRRNHIHHTGGHGEAFYLGGNNASAIFHDSAIVENYIHDLRGENVSQGDGIEIKHGSYGNEIARNVIHATNYPGIIAYGTNGQPRNRIVGNLVWDSSDSAIQVAADADVLNNLIANAGHGLYSRNHQQAVVGNMRIEGNTFVSKTNTAPIRIIPPDTSRPDGGLSGPILFNNNDLLGRSDELRIDSHAISLLTLTGNRGLGRVGDRRLRPTPTQPLAIPELPGHPAWEHLRRDDVRSAFQPR